MRHLAILLLLCLAPLGFSVATTTIDLRAVNPSPVNTIPASFTTTTAQDHVNVIVGPISRSLTLQGTQDWKYVDTTTSKTVSVAAQQTLTLTFPASANFTFDSLRTSADGVVSVLVVQ